MSGPKRTPIERDDDRTRIARLYLQRLPQSEIAERLSLSQSQVSRDLAWIRGEWKAARISAFDEWLNTELARIDALEIEYWDAWRDSKHDRESVTTETIPGKVDPVAFDEDGEGDEPPVTPPAPVVKTIARREGQTGNPAYLAGVQWCIGKRIELLGLAKPIKIAPTNVEGDKPYESLTDAERIERLVSLVDAARARRDGSAAGDGASGSLSEVPGEIPG